MQLDKAFLAGFAAGEGHFFVRPNNAGQSWCCGFELAQRDDNAGLLAAARDLAGCGRIAWVAARRTSHPQVAWLVQSIHDCVLLESCLAEVELLDKKSGELAIWRRAVAAWTETHRGRSRWKRLERSAYALSGHRRPDFVPDYTRVDIALPIWAVFSPDSRLRRATSEAPQGFPAS